VSVRAEGQGLAIDGADGVRVHNVRRELLDLLPVRAMERDRPAEPDRPGAELRVGVRCALPSKLMGNGIGRPAVQWCLDLQLDERTAGRYQADRLALGDLVALTDVDARWNIGFRRGWTTIGLVVHCSSPLPGHGPGIDVLLTGPAEAFALDVDPAGHTGVTEAVLAELERADAGGPA
jgi:hypothetical protein